MKKTYTTPTLILSGDVIHDTRIGSDDGIETQTQLAFRVQMAGSVGYYL